MCFRHSSHRSHMENQLLLPNDQTERRKKPKIQLLFRLHLILLSRNKKVSFVFVAFWFWRRSMSRIKTLKQCVYMHSVRSIWNGSFVASKLKIPLQSKKTTNTNTNNNKYSVCLWMLCGFLTINCWDLFSEKCLWTYFHQA